MQKKSTVNDLLTSIKHLEKTFSRYTSKPIVGQPLYELIIAEIDKQAEVDVPLTDDEVEVVGHGGGGSNVSDSNRKNNDVSRKRKHADVNNPNSIKKVRVEHLNGWADILPTNIAELFGKFERCLNRYITKGGGEAKKKHFDCWSGETKRINRSA